MPAAGNKIKGSHSHDCPPLETTSQTSALSVQDSILDQKMAVFKEGLDLNQQDFDCIVTLMLKILDGKCKMKEDDKIVIKSLYRCVVCTGQYTLNADLQKLIERSQHLLDEKTKLEIYEKRVLAETMISRPTMKAFKGRIRQAGIYQLLGD